MHSLKQHWDRTRNLNARTAGNGTVTLTPHDGRWHLVVPYHAEVPPLLRQLGGKWRYRSQCWSLPTNCRESLIQLIATYYGREKVPPFLAGGPMA